MNPNATIGSARVNAWRPSYTSANVTRCHAYASGKVIAAYTTVPAITNLALVMEKLVQSFERRLPADVMSIASTDIGEPFMPDEDISIVFVGREPDGHQRFDARVRVRRLPRPCEHEMARRHDLAKL